MKLTSGLTLAVLVGMVAVVISTIVVANQQDSGGIQDGCPFTYNELVTKSGLDTTKIIGLSRKESRASAMLSKDDRELLIDAIKHPLRWEMVDANNYNFDYLIVLESMPNFYYNSTDNQLFYNYEDLHQQELLDLVKKHTPLPFSKNCFKYSVKISVPDDIRNMVSNTQFELPQKSYQYELKAKVAVPSP